METGQFFSILNNSTGVVGTVVGFLGWRAAQRANRRVSQIKSLDLHIELKKLLNEVSLDLSQLPITMMAYRNSWSRFWAAKNMGNQGISNVAAIEADYDGPEITRLREALPENKRHEERSEKELEDLIVKVHAIQLRVNALKEKYEKKVHDLEMDRKNLNHDLEQDMKRAKEVAQAEQRERYRNPNSAYDVRKFYEAGGRM